MSRFRQANLEEHFVPIVRILKAKRLTFESEPGQSHGYNVYKTRLFQYFVSAYGRGDSCSVDKARDGSLTQSGSCAAKDRLGD